MVLIPIQSSKNKDNAVIATARNTAGSSGLQNLLMEDKPGRLVLVDLDVSRPESIHAAAETAAGIRNSGLGRLSLA